MIQSGATIWARQTIESDIFFDKPDKWFKIWFYLVNMVNFKDTKQFARGSGFTKYELIMHATGATKNQIDSFIRYAKEQSMLSTQKTTRGMVVTVTNYNTYQKLDNYKTDTQTETQPKHNRNTTDTIQKKGSMEVSKNESLSNSKPQERDVKKFFKENNHSGYKKFYDSNEPDWMSGGKPINNWKHLANSYMDNHPNTKGGIVESKTNQSILDKLQRQSREEVNL